MKRVLVVDFPCKTRRLLEEKLVEKGYQVEISERLKSPHHINQNSVEAVIIGDFDPANFLISDKPVLQKILELVKAVKVIVFSLDRDFFTIPGIKETPNLICIDRVQGPQAVLDQLALM